MKDVTFTSTISTFDSVNDLSQDVRDLMAKAVTIRKSAYAPYSNFRVGAAILLENGAVVVGSNQENAAFPSGLCAERVAIFQAGALYPEVKIKIIAISAASDTNQTRSPIPPCGACRQSILEYETKQNHDIEIYFMGEVGNVYKSASLSNLLPFSFDKKFL